MGWATGVIIITLYIFPTFVAQVSDHSQENFSIVFGAMGSKLGLAGEGRKFQMENGVFSSGTMDSWEIPTVNGDFDGKDNYELWTVYCHV